MNFVYFRRVRNKASVNKKYKPTYAVLVVPYKLFLHEASGTWKICSGKKILPKETNKQNPNHHRPNHHNHSFRRSPPNQSNPHRSSITSNHRLRLHSRRRRPLVRKNQRCSGMSRHATLTTMATPFTGMLDTFTRPPLVHSIGISVTMPFVLLWENIFRPLLASLWLVAAMPVC